MPVDDKGQAADADWQLLHFARTIFHEPPDKIGVAVSGGGDSMALLHLYAHLAKTEGVQIEAVTVDHRLRPEAADEAAMVSRFCAQNDIPHQTLHWDDWDQTGNLMAAARDARYRLIADWAKSRGIGGVVLGHTKDDLAETFIMRLARKSGPDGLAAMDVRFVRDGVQWARPLWQQSRADLRDYLQRHGVVWAEDPTNEDESFDRIRARKALEVLKPLGITPDVLKSVSGSMGHASQALNHYAQIEARRYVVHEQGDLVLRLGLTGPLPLETKRRLWTAAMKWVNGQDYPPRQAAFSDAIASVDDEGSTTIGGCLLTRKGDDWRVTREFQAVQGMAGQTQDIWDGRWRLNGPHAPDLQVRALGEGIRDCPDWRDTGLPRTSLIATPAVWRDTTLIAAPVAGLSSGWTAQIVADFHSTAFAH